MVKGTMHAIALMYHGLAPEVYVICDFVHQPDAEDRHVKPGVQEHLPHLGKLTHVEQVVELGRRRQHLGGHLFPQVHCERHQLLRYIHNLLREVVRVKATLQNT